MHQDLGIEWLVESIRITAFLSDMPKPRALEDWLEVASKNTPIQVSKSGSSFSGVSRCDQGFLRLDWTMGRIDAMIVPAEPQAANMIGTLDLLPLLLDFYAIEFPKIGSLPPLNRIAIGIILTMKVSDENAGLALVVPAIRGLSLDPRVRDFQYRSNIPITSKVIADLKINRLATWSVGQVQTIHVKIGSDGSQSHEVLALDPTAIRLELDINSDKEKAIGANQESSMQLLSEFKTHAIDIAKYGESAMLE